MRPRGPGDCSGCGRGGDGGGDPRFFTASRGGPVGRRPTTPISMLWPLGKRQWKHTRGSDQALGRSRGGFGTKLHIAVEGLGNPVEFIPTGGQEADINQGKALIGGHDAKAVIADKGYDGDDFVEAIVATGSDAVIPPKKNRV